MSTSTIVSTETNNAPSSLHPCIRVFGKCNFGKNCKFAALPANCCFSFLKDPKSCKSKTCKFPHVSIDGTVHHQDEKQIQQGALAVATTASEVINADDNVTSEVENNKTKVIEEIKVPIQEEHKANANADDDDSHDTSSTEDESKDEKDLDDTAAALVDENPAIAAEIAKWRKSCTAISNENKKLRSQGRNTAQGLKGQYEHRLKAEQAATLKLKADLDDASHELALQEEITTRLQKEIPAILLAKMSASGGGDKALDMDAEMAALRARVAADVFDGRRMSLLAKAFEVAAAKFKEQRDANGYGFSDLIRNECVFSDLSPVGAQFFKACPLPTLAKHLINKEDGSFNSDRFEITFHGTRGSVPAALSIQCEGFDPNRRSGQALGPGEYSATCLSTAMGYTSDAVLAVLVYKPDGVAPSYSEQLLKRYCRDRTGVQMFGPVYVYGTILVIDNPKDKSSTYMLPIGCAFQNTVLQGNGCALNRGCGCAQKHAASIVEEYQKKTIPAAPLTSSEFEGKRMYYKEVDQEADGETLIQFDDAATRHLMNLMRGTNYSGSATNHFVMIRDGDKQNVACSVDLKNLRMREVKSGRRYNLIQK